MEKTQQDSMPEDRRIKLLNFLLQKHAIPEYNDFNLEELISKIAPEDYKKIFSENPDFERLWQNVDMTDTLTQFLVDNGLAKKNGDNLRLTMHRGRDLQKQGSYGKLLEDERHIVDEARRVSELELEADRMARRQYKINVLIAFGTCMAAIYYILEILDGFLGFYPYHHH